ncbi:hypothetical protein [Desulfosoma sp.]
MSAFKKGKVRKNASARLSVREERLAALLALMVTEPEEPEAHLDEAMLVAFHEGRLNGQQEAVVREHVANCRHCYAMWQDARDCASTETEESVLAPFKEFLRQHGMIFRTGRIWAAGALAAASLVVILSLYPRGPSGFPLDEWATSELRGLVSISPGGLVPRPPGPVRSYRIKGFSPEKESLSRVDLTAFAAGVGFAAQKLAEKEPAWRPVMERLPKIPETCSWNEGALSCPEDRQWLVALGHWSALVSLACDAFPGGFEATAEGYRLERESRLSNIFRQVVRSNLPAETLEKISYWAPKGAAALPMDLCTLEPVTLARDLLKRGLDQNEK